MYTLFLIAILIILVLITTAIPIIFLLELFGWAWTGVPYVPVKKEVIARLPEALDLDDHSVLYDLGCGDGRVLRALAKQSNARCIGVEKAPLPFFLAHLRSMFGKQKNVRIIYGDMYKIPLEGATHIYVYLFTELMTRLLPKLEKELRPGTRVVSCDFRFKDREPSRTILCGAKKDGHTLYVYDF